MNYKTKQKIRNKTNLLYGLVNALKDDVDTLRVDASDCEADKLNESVRGTLETLEQLIDALSKVEYMLYLENTKGR